MRLKEDLNIDDIYINESFFYALRHNYLNPEDILRDKKDIDDINAAVELLSKFQNICDDLEIFG